MLCVEEREENEYVVRPCVSLGPHCPANLEQTSGPRFLDFMGQYNFPPRFWEPT